MNIFDATPDRVAFSIGHIDIMWYGILIACGFAVCIYIVTRRAPVHGFTGDKALNYSIFIAVAGILGARLYYVAFKLPYYLADPSRVFQMREGGLAIHGGLIGGIIITLALCKLWHDHPLNIMDLFIVVVPLGQAIGRWGNYFNGEAHGGPTDLPWGILVDGQRVHPTFLYESLWCLFLFFLLRYIDNRRRFTGQTFLVYCILYSAERFIVEQLRTDSLMLGPLKQAQVLSAAAIIAAAAAYYYLNKKSKASEVSEASNASEVSEANDASEVNEASNASEASDASDESEANPPAPPSDDVVADAPRSGDKDAPSPEASEASKASEVNETSNASDESEANPPAPPEEQQ
jgi:phosphatidylglycerol:prolipoprotein diacylglycerol transferase